MTYLLGVDTGGTYTDAVILDEASETVIATAKSLTTRPQLALGVGAAIDAVLENAQVAPTDVAMVALSTTLATIPMLWGPGRCRLVRLCRPILFRSRPPRGP